MPCKCSENVVEFLVKTAVVTVADEVEHGSASGDGPPTVNSADVAESASVSFEKVVIVAEGCGCGGDGAGCGGGASELRAGNGIDNSDCIVDVSSAIVAAVSVSWTVVSSSTNDFRGSIEALGLLLASLLI